MDVGQGLQGGNGLRVHRAQVSREETGKDEVPEMWEGGFVGTQVWEVQGDTKGMGAVLTSVEYGDGREDIGGR